MLDQLEKERMLLEQNYTPNTEVSNVAYAKLEADVICRRRNHESKMQTAWLRVVGRRRSQRLLYFQTFTTGMRLNTS